MSDPGAAVKWPNVPACYGWLSLDRRGIWRLKGEAIRHAGLIEFINRNYGADAYGNWIFQNGPQAVFVALDYTPLVLRLETDGGLRTHTGADAGSVAELHMDEKGCILLATDSGIGLLDDRDLAGFVADCRDAHGQPATEDALLDTMNGGAGLFWRGLPLRAIRCRDVPLRFGFRPDPAP